MGPQQHQLHNDECAGVNDIRIAHQSLDLDQLPGLQTVLFPDHVGRIENVALVGSKANGDGFGNQLQGIPVAGGDDAAHPFVGVGIMGHRP